MRAACVSLGLLVCSLGASSYRDVPLGYCHDCEVTCFEDCMMKYDREIIQPDITGAMWHSRGDTRVEAAMKNKLYGVVLRQNVAGPSAKATVTSPLATIAATAAATATATTTTTATNATTAPTTATATTSTSSAALPKLSSSYRACLKEDNCPCNQKTRRKGSSLLAASCKVGAKPCALGCVNKTLDKAPALLQTAARVFPGPLDENDAAIPWSNNVHPVEINSFATGRQDLEQCHRSCLAATCGCENAPGLENINNFKRAIKVNDMSKLPVEDTKPAWQYKRADIRECGKGMKGKKVTQGMYADLVGGPEGWVEVCSDDFFTQQGTAADVGKKNCDNPRAELAGCLWDRQRSSCVYGLNPKMINCYTRYLDDDKL